MAGGRPIGSMNKNSQFLLTRLQDMYGDDFHPIMKMAENCETIQGLADDSKLSLEEIQISEPKAQVDEDSGEADFSISTRVISLAKLANENWEKLAPYIAPKLKAVELTGEEGGPVQVQEVQRTIVDPKEGCS